MAASGHLEVPEPSEATAAESRSDVRRFVQLALDRVWIIALCVVFTCLVATIYLRRAPRIYQATAVVQIESAPHTVIDIEEVMADELATEASVNTMVQKLRSRPLLAWVIEVNRLDQNPAFLGRTGGPPPDKAILVSRLEGMVTTTLRRMTRLADVTVSSADPKLAAQIANSIVAEFTGQDSVTRSSHTRNASGFLQEEAARLKAKLEQSEEALQKYREEAGTVGLQSPTYFLPSLQAANVRRGQAHAEAVRLEARYAQICSLTNQVESLLALPQVATEPALTQSRLRFAEAQREFADLQLRYKPKHPKYQQTAARLDEARQTLVREALQLPESYRLAYETALTTLTNTAAAVKEAEAEALRFSAQAIRFNMLAREVESDRALFASVLKRLAETSLTTAIRSEKIRVIQPAIVPRAPSSPRVYLILLVAVGTGLIGGLMLVFGLHSLDRSIQSVEQAEQDLGLPVLNVIPRIKETEEGSPLLVGAESTRSSGAEAFRTLRAALGMLGRAEDRRTFLFTSATPQEGKTFTSANYAASLAQQGLKTLLIDADLRRPSVQTFLTGGDEEHLAGVTDYLTGRKALDEILRLLPDYPNLTWIAAGTTAPNPAELLAQDGLRGLLAEALKRFDRVVVDTAPVTAVSDTLTIARNVQTTVLVVRSHYTPRQPIQRTLHLLKQAGAKLGGVVLNLQPQHWGPGYYYSDVRYYHTGYSHDSQDRRKAKSRKSRPSPRPGSSAV
jgi:capsular exopolysaccharide synthesis family protein